MLWGTLACFSTYLVGGVGGACAWQPLFTLISPSNLPCGFCYHHYMERPRRAGQLCTTSSSRVPTCVLGMPMVLKSSKYSYHGESRFWTLLILSCMLCICPYKSSHETKLRMRAASFLVMVEDASGSSCGVVPFLVLI